MGALFPSQPFCKSLKQFDCWTFAGLSGISNFNFSFSCKGGSQQILSTIASNKECSSKEECTLVVFLDVLSIETCEGAGGYRSILLNLACSLSLSFSFSCSSRSRSRSRSSACIEKNDNQMALILFHQSSIFQNVSQRSSDLGS